MFETELCAGSGNEATVDNEEKSTGLRKEVTSLSSMPQIEQVGRPSCGCQRTYVKAIPGRNSTTVAGPAISDCPLACFLTTHQLFALQSPRYLITAFLVCI